MSSGDGSGWRIVIRDGERPAKFSSSDRWGAVPAPMEPWDIEWWGLGMTMLDAKIVIRRGRLRAGF